MKKRERMIIIALISIFVFAVVVALIEFRGNFFDYSISNSISGIQGNLINVFFIFLGEYSKIIMIIIAIAVAVLLYLEKRKKQSLVFALTLGAGLILEQIFKFILERGRPAVQLILENDYSFPSGHSIFSIILFSFIICFYKDKIKNRAIKVLFILINIFLIILIGFSRIYLNVHWLTDVIGGYALGFFLFCLGVLILENKKL